MDLHALIDPDEYKRQYPDTPYCDGHRKYHPTGPLANKSLSGTFPLQDMLSDESLAALYRAKLRAERKI